MSASGADEFCHFLLRLEQTIAYCASRADIADPVNCLRTLALPPPLAAGDDSLLGKSRDERCAIVEEIGSLRHDLLGAGHSQRRLGSALTPAGINSTLAGGRLLAFDPDHSLSDGAAWGATSGYFDGANNPPWDTWVCYVAGPENEGWDPFDSFLLSWVPQEFIEPVAAAVDVNPEECILWASDVDVPFIRKLRAAGLVP